MIGNTVVRIGVVVGILAATYAFASFVQAKLTVDPERVQMPAWSFHDLPLQIGEWRGETAKLDPKIAVKTGAVQESIEERTYRDESGHQVALFAAIYQDVTAGAYHTPMNCYRANGWRLVGSTSWEHLPLSDSESSTVPVSLTTWEREGGEQEMVVYWYQLGKHTLFGRWDLGIKVRWSLAGQQRWPPLLKIMLSTQGSEDSKNVLLSFAELVARWTNQPAHHTGFAEAASEDAPQDAAAAP